MMAPIVSVVVPVYNAQAYLEECINSIRAQTVTNWQLVLVNDGSTDHSEEICRQYAEKDARIVYLPQKNQGVSAARNHGIAASEGDWLTFLDSDDTLAPFAFELVSNLPKNCQMVMSGIQKDKTRLIQKDGYRELPSLKLQKAVLNLKAYLDSEEKIEILDDFSTWSSCAKFFRRDVIVANNIRYPETLKLSEDTLFCMQVYHCVSTVWINESSIYYYRTNQSSATMSYRTDRVENMLHLLEKMEPLIQEPELLPFYYQYVVAALTVCCTRYYADEHCKLSLEEAAEQLKEVCENKYLRTAIRRCNYKNIMSGKKNSLRAAITLFFMRHHRYLPYLSLMRKRVI